MYLGAKIFWTSLELYKSVKKNIFFREIDLFLPILFYKNFVKYTTGINQFHVKKVDVSSLCANVACLKAIPHYVVISHSQI